MAGKIMSIKITVTPSGIETATFHFVAQCLNQLLYRLSPYVWITVKINSNY
jgi:hypothetical protein